MEEVFKINMTLRYNHRTHKEFFSRFPKTVKYGEKKHYNPQKKKIMFLFESF